ncbi:hypothetical protein NXG04_07575 [Klebsiella pneumoniae]|nr:hypothetical protein [Klebsiella pneumoniae]MDS7714413.1 hypothetical protein [Klebsiella pneumoniae]UUV46295.1 hypothetical protein [Bacillus phage vB_BanS-Thrax2]
MTLIQLKIDGDYKSIEVEEYELKALLATGKFIKLGGEYYNIDHISKFNESQPKKQVPLKTNPVPKQILFKKG